MDATTEAAARPLHSCWCVEALKPDGTAWPGSRRYYADEAKAREVHELCIAVGITGSRMFQMVEVRP